MCSIWDLKDFIYDLALALPIAAVSTKDGCWQYLFCVPCKLHGIQASSLYLAIQQQQANPIFPASEQLFIKVLGGICLRECYLYNNIYDITGEEWQSLCDDSNSKLMLNYCLH